MSYICEPVEEDELVLLPNGEPADLDEVVALLGRTRPNFSKAKGICRECGAPKSERRLGADFCSDRCRGTFHNRAKMEGAYIIHIAKRWRRFRDSGDFSLFTKMLDDLIRADKDHGRSFYPKPPTHAHAKVVATNVSGRRRGSK